MKVMKGGGAAGEDGIKGNIIEIKPLSSSEMIIIDTDTFLDKLEELFESKMKCIMADCRSKVVTSADSLKSDIKSESETVGALKSDVTANDEKRELELAVEICNDDAEASNVQVAKLKG